MRLFAELHIGMIAATPRAGAVVNGSGIVDLCRRHEVVRHVQTAVEEYAASREERCGMEYAAAGHGGYRGKGAG